jgi:hypothetical protein
MGKCPGAKAAAINAVLDRTSLQLQRCNELIGGVYGRDVLQRLVVMEERCQSALMVEHHHDVAFVGCGARIV